MPNSIFVNQSLLISLIALILTPLSGQVTSSGWVNTIAGADYQITADVKTDDQGNIYTIGSFSGTTDFDGSNLTNNKTSEGETDIFVTKHLPNGQLSWVATFGGNSEDIGFGLDINDSGDVYAVGSFNGLATFHTQSPDGLMSSAGQEDMFIVKLNSSGVVQWNKRIGSTSVDEANDIAIDHDHNVYVVGRFVGTVDFNPGSGTSNLQAGGAPDAFILKLNSEGEFIWAYDIGSSNNDEAEAVAIDGQNNIIIAGVFDGSVDFDPGPGEHKVSDGSGIGGPFHLKLTPTGAFVWVTEFTCTGYTYAGDVDVDKDNNIVTHGFYTNNINPDPDNAASAITSAGAEDSYTAKIYANGEVAWFNTIRGESLEFGYGVAVDPIGDVYVTGFYWESPDFDPGTEELFLPSVGIEDAYIVKYSSQGQLVWVKQVGGLSGDSGYGIDINGSGDILVAGNYWGDADLDPEPNGTLTVKSKGSADVFVLHIEQMISGSDDLALNTNWQLSPNPSKGTLTISGIEQFPVSVTLMDMTGSALFEPRFLYSANPMLDFQSLPAGIYFIQIRSTSERAVRKWIKI